MTELQQYFIDSHSLSLSRNNLNSIEKYFVTSPTVCIPQLIDRYCEGGGPMWCGLHAFSEFGPCLQGPVCLQLLPVILNLNHFIHTYLWLFHWATLVYHHILLIQTNLFLVINKVHFHSQSIVWISNWLLRRKNYYNLSNFQQE